MSNTSYLCCSNLRRIYPSFENREFDAQINTLACDVEAVPVLWLAMFRPANWSHEVFACDGRQIQAQAPLAERQSAVQQLELALPVLDRVFAGWGSFTDHVQMMKDCLDQAEGEFVSIEWEEIACIWDKGEEHFYATAKAIFSFWDSPHNDLNRIRRQILDMASFRRANRLPPARGLVDDVELSETEEWNLVRIFGASHYRAVPWE